jgi:transcription elongation factor Elf1
MSQTTRLTELPAVARSVSLNCSFCEAERFFKVLTHLSDEAAKLRCEVCGRSKTFRLSDFSNNSSGGSMATDKPAKKSPKKSAAPEVDADGNPIVKEKKPRNTAGLQAAAEKRKLAAAEKKAETAARKDAEVKADYVKQYESLKKQIGVAKVVPYGMKANFIVANAVQHPTFGLGFVTMATAEKIEVAFESGVRSLIHNRTS